MRSRSIIFLAFPLAIIVTAAVPAQGRLVGNVFTQPLPAANFTLTDQNGKPFTMAETKGKVVVLSFIYTHCTDFCPFVALKLKAAAALVARDARGVEIVPVTTDPGRDTVEVLADYSKVVGMLDTWHFVTGPLPVMRKVWKDYYISVEFEQENPAPLKTGQARQEVDAQADKIAQQVFRGLRDTDNRLAGSIIQEFGGGYEVSHDIPFWIVDKKGMMRVSLEADATPADIAGDIRTLLAEK